MKTQFDFLFWKTGKETKSTEETGSGTYGTE
jgi:hypothetical protein